MESVDVHSIEEQGKRLLEEMETARINIVRAVLQAYPPKKIETKKEDEDDMDGFTRYVAE